MMSQEEWSMIRQLRNQGLTISEIARQLEVDRKTVRSTLRKEESPKYRRVVGVSLLDDYRNYIDQRLENYNLTSQKIFEEILTLGYLGKYGIVNNYVRRQKDNYKTKAILRFETIPGEQAQVDWAYFGEFYDQEKKRFVRLCCFLMVLGFSRMRFVHFFESDDTSHFLWGHNLAFEYFKGYTKEILYDNLKSVVVKRAFKQKDSEFNKEFLEYAGYYGFKAVLSVPYRPQTKGKVENTVRYVRENFFAGEEFRSVREINIKVLEWINRINNQVHHTTHEKPIERILREQLTPLVRLYDLSKVYYRKVQRDCHFSFKGNFYSCPPAYAGKEVVVKQTDEDHIFVYYRNERIGFHTLEHVFKGGYLTSPSHYLEIKALIEKQSRQAWRNKKLERKNRVKNYEVTEPVCRRASFNSNQVIQLFPEVEKRDLRVYEEVQ